MFDERFDVSRPMFAIINEFDLAAHVERLLIRHPGWSERQLVCCLYWQPTARKQHKALILQFLRQYPGYYVDVCPEAGGVNVTDTLKAIGIELEWPPHKIVRQVGIGGRKKSDV